MNALRDEGSPVERWKALQAGTIDAAIATLRSSGLIPPEAPDPIAAAVDYSYLG